MQPENAPASLLECITYFADEDRAHDFFVTMRWENGIRCVHCQSENIGSLSRSVTKSGTVRRVWNCKNCHKQFTAKMGTIFAESPLPLSKWLPALWLITNAKNGISSCELARALKITQKSAWFMGHRIRAAIQRGGGIINDATGVFEVDESFIGGAARNMHYAKKQAVTGGKAKMGAKQGKSIVMGLLARHSATNPHSKVVTRVVSSTKSVDLRPHIEKHVPAGAEVHTDAHGGYSDLGMDYRHRVVDHAERYVDMGVHTNGLENYWCLLKRTLGGTYVHCQPFHLFRYLDEQTYRFNARRDEDGDRGRFLEVTQTAVGRRLTWKNLTAKEEQQ